MTGKRVLEWIRMFIGCFFLGKKYQTYFTKNITYYYMQAQAVSTRPLIRGRDWPGNKATTDNIVGLGTQLSVISLVFLY